MAAKDETKKSPTPAAMARANDTIRHLNRVIDNLNAQIEDHESEMKSKSAELEVMKARVSAMEEEAERTADRVHQLEEDNAELTAQIRVLTTQKPTTTKRRKKTH